MGDECAEEWTVQVRVRTIPDSYNVGDAEVVEIPIELLLECKHLLSALQGPADANSGAGSLSILYKWLRPVFEMLYLARPMTALRERYCSARTTSETLEELEVAAP